MIAYLNGKIVVSRQNYLILNVGGVGYKIFSNLSNLVNQDNPIELFIYEHIREDINDLYGFGTIDELEIFQKLILVNGVGPKAGMAIMTMANPERISHAIIAEDVSFFQAIPGIGKKVAAKIILDLKSKISDLESGDIFGHLFESDDVANALATLGYKNSEIAGLITKIPSNIKTSEEKIRWCLRHISK